MVGVRPAKRQRSLCGEALETRLALASEPMMLVDTNTTADTSWEFRFAPFGEDQVLFTAHDPETGLEPWVTDGTTQGTRPLVDALAGPQSSLAENSRFDSNLIDFASATDGSVYVPTATRAMDHYELRQYRPNRTWQEVGFPKVDRVYGTAGEYTYIYASGLWRLGVDQVAQRISTSRPRRLLGEADGYAYFAFDDGDDSDWTQVVTPAGELLPERASEADSSLVMDGRFYFSDRSNRIFVADGSELSVASELQSNVDALFEHNSELVALVNASSISTSLRFVHAGTSESLSPSGDWDQVVDSNNRLFAMTAHHRENGRLGAVTSDGWRSLGTEWGRLQQPTAFGTGILFFEQSEVSTSLWFTDADDIRQVALFEESVPGDEMALNVNGRNFFVMNHPTLGKQLWVTDGTTQGTTLLRNLWYRNEGIVGYRPLVAGDRLFFNGYVTDGSPEGTFPYPNKPLHGSAHSLIEQLPEGDLRMTLTLSDGQTQVQELVSSTNATSFEVHETSDHLFVVEHGDSDRIWSVELDQGFETLELLYESQRAALKFTTTRSELYFLVSEQPNMFNGWEIWSSDGTRANTQSLTEKYELGLVERSWATTVYEDAFFVETEIDQLTSWWRFSAGVPPVLVDAPPYPSLRQNFVFAGREYTRWHGGVLQVDSGESVWAVGNVFGTIVPMGDHIFSASPTSFPVGYEQHRLPLVNLDSPGPIFRLGNRIVYPHDDGTHGLEVWAIEMQPAFDVNRDLRVDADDRDLIAAAISLDVYDAYFDVNLDERLDALDLVAVSQAMDAAGIGDVAVDGVFDSSDLVALFQAGKFETDLRATYSEGDFNGDGLFTSADLVLALSGIGTRHAFSLVS